MGKLIIFLLVGLILASTLLTGISLAGEDKADESKEEIKEAEGYQLTPADKRSQLISILIILAIMVLTI
ncbi:hypothetical protein LR013_06065 [candidate division NPL-UPA2 bacterium]|nr:hypothetical protein [candidate division NPL-UPA2 bacterium]